MEALIIITSSQPQERGTAAAPPLGLAAPSPAAGLTCLEQWWEALAAAGAPPAPAATFLATNALYYKYFE